MQRSNRRASRRSFLKCSAAMALGTRLAWSEEPSAPEFAGLKLGIQSYTLRDRTFEKMLEAMKNDLKLHWVELFGAHLSDRMSPRHLEEAKKKMADAQVT